MEQQLKMRIILQKPPAGVDFGLQKGKGSDYETIQTQRSSTHDLSFEFSLKIRPGTDVIPVFTGPFAQGPADARFVYIDIGTYAGQTNTQWSRRLKIPLSGITWQTVNEVSSNSSMILEAQVAGM